LFFGRCFIYQLAHRPSHIHTTAKLVEAARDVADAHGLTFVAIKAPQVEQRHGGIEQARADALGGAADFRGAPNIATLCVQVIVRHKDFEAGLTLYRGGRGNGRCVQRFEPSQRIAPVIVQSRQRRCCHQCLK